MAMNSWNLSRRDFLKQASAFALTSGVVLRQAVAQTAGDNKFVTAETAFGRIRGIDENGVKIFKGVPYGAGTSGRNRFMPPLRSGEMDGREGRARIRS
jgi:para-nitrobenzyl esterase